MESKQANFGSCEWIHTEIQRRASVLTQTDSAAQGGEDPYVIVSRQVFEELLRTFAETARARAA
jgi:hypothetical protein